MADWVSITNSQVDPDAPLTSELAYAWRDNVIAVTEGAVGAPRVQFSAMDSWFSTAGAVGTYIFARAGASPATVAFGATTAGSNLRTISAVAATAATYSQISFALGTTPAGTWRCMGTFTNTASGFIGATLWLRIS